VVGDGESGSPGHDSFLCVVVLIRGRLGHSDRRASGG
jgi:hypothetical protein